MLDKNDVLSTMQMIDRQHLDIRTITMGISLLSCADRDAKAACEKIYDKITRYAEGLVKTGEDIEREFGIPIVNKRISVTPIALVAAASETEDYVPFAVALDRAAKAVGVNFIGGFSALVQKGMTDADRRLIAAIPEALAVTDLVCSSVNVGSTKAGINMDAVALMGRTVKAAAERTADCGGFGCAKLVDKAFEQCAGFLRVPESKNVLDNTGVHPESYDAAKWLLELLGATPKDARDLPARLNAYGAEKAAEALGVGVPTLRDIAKELSKPGRDPRDELPAPILRTDVLDIKDLKPGMVLTGTVRNVIDFGVFVDIGVHQDGLVHISQVCNKFIKHPSEAVAVGDVVKVVVLDVDEKKHRISLSMKQVPEE